MGANLSGKAVIAGIGATKFGALPGRTTISMNVEAIRKALNDAGIEKDAVDALYVKCPTSKFEMMYGQKIAEAIGLQPRIGGVWDSGGSSNVIMISQAIMAIEAGQCEIAVVTFADNPKTGSAASYSHPRGEDALYGWFAVLSSYAMIARRHMGELGTPREALGAVAVAARRHGAQNPNAQLRKPLALDEYMDMPPMVAPFCRDDCTLVSDGAAAVVVMSTERARKMGVRETGARPGLRIWPNVVGRDAAARHDFDAGESRRRNCAQDGRPETQRHGRRANLRLFHHYGIDDARRLRLRQERAGRRLREGWQHRDRRRAADEHVGRTPVGDRHARHAADPRGRPADARRRCIASQRRKTLHHF